MRYQLFVATLLVVSAAPAVVCAQSADSVPRELALALLRGREEGMQLFVAKTPERFPLELAPLNARLLGALQRDRSTTVVYVSTLEPDAARRAWESQMRAAGWSTPPGYAPLPAGGFVSTTAPIAVPAFCGNGVFASLSPGIRFNGGSTLVLNYTDPTLQSMCTVAQSHPQVAITRDTIPLPQLMPPRNVTVVGFTTGANVDFWEQRATITGAATSDSLLRHYSEQFTKAGWTAGPVATTGQTSAQTFRTKLAGNGAEVAVSLVVQTNPFDSTTSVARLAVHRRR
jgi:hypothetical protein